MSYWLWSWRESLCVKTLHEHINKVKVGFSSRENLFGVTSHSLCVGYNVAKDVIIGLLHAGFYVQLKFRNVHRFPVWLLVNEWSRRGSHLLDPALHLRHLLHRLSGIFLLHLHLCCTGATLNVLQPYLAASGRLQGRIIQVPWGRSGIVGGFIQVGKKFGEKVSTVRLKNKPKRNKLCQ